VGDVDHHGGPGPVAVDRAQAGGEPRDALRGVGAAVQRIDHDHQPVGPAVAVVDARLLRQHPDAGTAQHLQCGGVRGQVAVVLTGPGAGQPPVGYPTESAGDLVGRVVEQGDQTFVGEGHPAGLPGGSR
jgi:hypothetical protein